MPTLEDEAVKLLCDKGFKITCAESCTGGLLSGRLINVSGASDVINIGFVTYSNDAKMEYLGVEEEVLRDHGAVSSECAAQMAEGAAKRGRSQVGLSTTGIAGPGGGSSEKPVGLVYIGCNVCGNVTTIKCNFSGDRQSVRAQAVEAAIKLLIDSIEKYHSEK